MDTTWQRNEQHQVRTERERVARRRRVPVISSVPTSL
jgi:hypothetical protein